ncbi:MAG: acyl-CoA dehydrogenase family protein, partial [Planctomycetota bacterium]
RARHQFQRPLSDFDLVKQRIANMSALTYAMDAMLYMTTGFLDRKDSDIMVETAICKTFCSEMGWRVVNDAIQIMGGESYMTENEVERAFRDSRINIIVEGANEVMQCFIFGYGGKSLAEQMVGVQERLLWNGDESFGGNVSRILKNSLDPKVMGLAIPLGLELFLGLKKAAPKLTKVHPSLSGPASRIGWLIREHSHQFKIASKINKEKILERQTVQARVGDVAIYLHAMVCTLSKLDQQLRAGHDTEEFARDKAAAMHFFELAEGWIHERWRAIHKHADVSMREAAAKAIAHNDTLPTDRFVTPERSPVAQNHGRTPDQTAIRQFPGDGYQARTGRQLQEQAHQH